MAASTQQHVTVATASKILPSSESDSSTETICWRNSRMLPPTGVTCDITLTRHARAGGGSDTNLYSEMHELISPAGGGEGREPRWTAQSIGAAALEQIEDRPRG